MEAAFITEVHGSREIIRCGTNVAIRNLTLWMFNNSPWKFASGKNLTPKILAGKQIIKMNFQTTCLAVLLVIFINWKQLLWQDSIPLEIML